jgi:hypothetical protein
MIQVKLADSPLLDAFRRAARDVDDRKRMFRSWAAGVCHEDLVAVDAAPSYRAALRTAFPQ